MKSIEEMKMLIESYVPVIWAVTHEEERVIDEVCKDIIGVEKKVDPVKKKEKRILKDGFKLYVWSFTQGLVSVDRDKFTRIHSLKAIDSSGGSSGSQVPCKSMNPVEALELIRSIEMDDENQRCLIIMRDLSPLMKQPNVPRKLRDIMMAIGSSTKTIIITGPWVDIPTELEKDIARVDFALKTKEEMKENLVEAIQCIKKRNKDAKEEDKNYKPHKEKYTEEEVDILARCCTGLSEQEVDAVLEKSLYLKKCFDADIIISEKKEIIKKSDILEYWDSVEDMNNVGGCDNLKEWLYKREKAFGPEAEAFGLPAPRGILIVGVQGCGKSLIAKATANVWKLPLLRFDVGKVFAGLVGQSENNMRKMIATAEAVAPCILWIDEMEKGLSGTKSSNMSDAGTTSRVFGTFATWLNEKKKGVFVVATANDVSQLPAELLRKGRFDEIWFIDVPTEIEREEIFKIQIQKVGRNPKKFDLVKLSKAKYKRESRSFDYTGAEIELAVQEAMWDAFDKGGIKGGKNDINTKDILNVLQKTVPITNTMREKIEAVQAWGSKRARFASSLAENAINTGERKPGNKVSLDNVMPGNSETVKKGSKPAGGSQSLSDVIE